MMNSFDIVAAFFLNNVQCCFDIVDRCFDIVAGVDEALGTPGDAHSRFSTRNECSNTPCNVKKRNVPFEHGFLGDIVFV